MIESVWDVFSDNVFVKRVHYRGYVGKVITLYRDKGTEVSVIEKRIDF